MQRLITFLFAGFLFSGGAVGVKAGRVNVRIVPDEARAVISVLEKRKNGQTPADDDWQKIFSSEGYRRLKKRELSLKRSFTDEDLKKFVLSDELLARFESLRETLAAWEKVDASSAARAALRYLPAAAQISAKVYPVIKPRDNSFVFEVKTDPAIFLYLDPQVTRAQFENTLAHELHHIGFGSACPRAEIGAELEKMTAEKQEVFKWLGAFGEGLAMLAAAGGPDAHPHRVSRAEDRARWDRDAANFNEDRAKVEAFFRDVLEKRLTGDKINETGFSFFGVQGAWYTVGWQMAAAIEKAFGRSRLIEAFCDPRKLLPTYNEAVRRRKNLAPWSGDLLESLR